MLQLLISKVSCLRQRPERGQVLVEYGLIVALIALVGVVGIMAVGGGVGALFSVIEAATCYLGGPAACP